MKLKNKLNLTVIWSVIFLLFVSLQSFSQQYRLSNPNSDLKVYGTSSLHDWHEDVEEQSGTISIDVTENLKIKSLNLEVVSESLKSGKRGMDKNTYKALNTDEYKTISFQLTETKNITKLSDQKYKVEAYGNLTISGVTKRIQLNFELSMTNNQINLIGEKSFKMTDFKIEPPKALFGTITTGDDITIKFNTVLK
ncbi:MAG: YceI family protein [Algicola sp.]|nr:YceI family protein [Algicola sp.]